MKRQSKKVLPITTGATLQTRLFQTKLRIAEITFDSGFPEDQRVRFYAYLLKYENFIPTWVHDLRLQWAEFLDNDNAMQIHMRPEYREATIVISKEHVDSETQDTERDFVHEIAHLTLGPLFFTAASLLDDTLSSEGTKVKDMSVEALRQANEGSTQDLARSIYSALNK